MNQDRKVCPKQNASLISRLTFSWFNAFAWKGYKKTLEAEDMWSISSEDLAAIVVPKFEKCLAEYTNHKQRLTKHATAHLLENKTSNIVQISIIWPLARAFGSSFLLGAVLKFTADILIFANPQILK